MRGLTVQAMAVAAASVASVLSAVGLSPVAGADPVLVFPGMEIHQDTHVCTLGYVDPVQRVAFTAGHCRGSGLVTDRDGNLVGKLVTFRDNTPTGTTVNTDQTITDYESILLADEVATNNILPDGRELTPTAGLTVEPGDPVCHFGVATGESCGVVDRANNGWFTMTGGVVSERGDSGGPVYVNTGGQAQLVGLFNSVWGDYPSAVAWRSVAQQVQEDIGKPAA